MRVAFRFGIFVTALLAVLYLGFRPAPPPEGAGPAPAPAPAEAAPGTAGPGDGGGDAPADAIPAGNTVSAEWTLLGGTLIGPAVVHARQGDTVSLRFIGDRDDELHLHGYDLTQPVTAGTPSLLVFQAEHAGRFDLELHGAHRELGALEVQPR